MGWKDTITEETPSHWKDTIQEEVPWDDPRKSKVTSAALGLVEGAVPFASSIAGAGKAGLDAITGVRGPLAGGDLGDVLDDYREARDSVQNDSRIARDANYKTSLAAGITGGLANPLFKGADTLPKMATAGAIHGVGASDADLTKGELPGAALSGGLGAAGGAVGYGIGKGIQAATPYAKKVSDFIKSQGKKALTVLGPPEEAITARFAGRAQNHAPNYSELSKDMVGSLEDLGQQMSEYEGASWDVLSNKPTIPKQNVLDILQTLKGELKLKGSTFGDSNRSAEAALARRIREVKEIGKPPKIKAEPVSGAREIDLVPAEKPVMEEKLSERDIKQLVRDLDHDIDWEDTTEEVKNRFLERARNGLDDQLKFGNKEYEKIMAPHAERTATEKAIRGNFRIKKSHSGDLSTSDTTSRNIQLANRAHKDETTRALEKLNEFTGRDYLDEANDFRLAETFRKTAPNGSRRVNLLKTVGKSLGSETGGAIAGGVSDSYGGKALGAMIDAYVKVGNWKVFGKFGNALRSAYERSPQAGAIMGALLSKDPEFRKQLGIE